MDSRTQNQNQTPKKNPCLFDPTEEKMLSTTPARDLAPTTPASNSVPITSTSTTPPGSARRNRGRGRKGKAWKEAKSWRQGPVQFGDMAAVHSESSGSSSALEGTSTPKQSPKIALDNEDEDVETSVENLGKKAEPVDAEVVVGTPPKAFTPKGEFVWADEFDEVEEVEESSDFAAFAMASSQEGEEAAMEEVVEESSDIVAEAGNEEESEEAGQADPAPAISAPSDPEILVAEAKVPELTGDFDSSPSVVSEAGMLTTPDFEQLPEVEVAVVEAIVPEIAEDFAEVEVEAVSGAQEDTVSKESVPDSIVAGDSEDFASPETPLEIQDDLPAEEENVQAALEHSEEATGSDDVDSEPSTPKQSTEIVVDNEIDDIQVSIEHPVEVSASDEDNKVSSTPKLEEGTEIAVDNEPPVTTTPIQPAVPAIAAISYAQIAAAAAAANAAVSALTARSLSMSSEPGKDIEKAEAIPRTPVKIQTLRVQTSTPIPTPTRNVQPTSTTLEIDTSVSPFSPADDLEWEPMPTEANQQPSEWSTVTPKKPRKPTSPSGSHNGGSDNGDEDEAVPETPTKSKSKRRRPKSRAVRAAERAAALAEANALAGAKAVDTPPAETRIQTPTQVIEAAVVEEVVVAELEMEIEVAERQASEVENVQEERLVADNWSSAKRLFLVVFALWFCYSCIYYLPDFLQWLKDTLTSEVPEL